MSAYLAGHLLGRLVISYAIVWCLMCLGSRFQWRVAFQRTHAWYGIAAVASMFLIGSATALLNGPYT